MNQAHLLLAYATAALTVVLAVVALLAAVRPRRARSLLDRTILAIGVALAISALSGLVLPVLSGGPADPLHFLYAIVAPVVIFGARYLGRAPDVRRRGLWMLAAAIVLAGIVLRLFTTG